MSQSEFFCQVCGETASADINGARNIFAANHVVLDGEETMLSVRPLKEKPTEMIQAIART
ncbi:TPA: transposase [Salmonella enterica subsp. enterica serovar Blitta]|nr:transposase [Salmonella enterica subsp. enterica serovar Blitta]